MFSKANLAQLFSVPHLLLLALVVSTKLVPDLVSVENAFGLGSFVAVTLKIGTYAGMVVLLLKQFSPSEEKTEPGIAPKVATIFVLALAVPFTGLGLAMLQDACTPAQQATAANIEKAVLNFLTTNAGTIEALEALVTPFFPAGTALTVIETALHDALDLLVSVGDVPPGKLPRALELQTALAAKRAGTK